MKLLKNILLRLLPLYHKLKVCFLRHKEHINVVFFAMSLSMWRYQKLYELLLTQPRFKAYIIICPSCEYEYTQQLKDQKELMEYFNSKRINYIVVNEGSSFNLRKEISPDIMFYPQPYNGYYPKQFSYNSYYDKLLCYFPYAYWDIADEWSYTHPLHNTAWKLFYPNKVHRDDAYKFAFRKGHNMEVVGYPTADEFMSGIYKDRWRQQNAKKKRIIWAPHYSVTSSGHISQSNFLWMSEFMLDVAKRYSDKIQFAFKPHPRLYTELCALEGWGQEKAREYYNIWANMSNTQLETGEFVDLFMTSDAMIHDSGSFVIEYHYSKNPVMYIMTSSESSIQSKNEVGQKALEAHYIGSSQKDIIKFINEVVIENIDIMRSVREDFYENYLIPPSGLTVAENAMNVLLTAL